MDPASVIGIVGSIAGVLDIATRSISKLSLLRSRYRQANLFVSTLLGQLCTVQASLEQLKRLQQSAGFHRALDSQELRTAFKVSLEGCDILLISLEEQLDQLSKNEEGNLYSRSKLVFMWHDQEVKDYLDLLDRQINTLNLLLQATQCTSLYEQQALLKEEDSITVLRLAKECTESLVVLDDAESRATRNSLFSQSSERLSRDFDFDAQILGSRVYQAVSKYSIRALLRRNSPRLIVPQSQDQDSLLKNLRRSTKSTSSVSDITAYRDVVESNAADLRKSKKFSRLDSKLDSKTVFGLEAEPHISLGTDARGSISKPSSSSLQPDLQSLQVDRPAAEPSGDSDSDGSSLTERLNVRRRHRKEYAASATRTLEIDQESRSHRINMAREIKICVLGDRQVGIPAIINSMRVSYGNIDEHLWKVSICDGIFREMQALLRDMEASNVEFDSEGRHDDSRMILSAPKIEHEGAMSRDLGLAIQRLWADSGLQTYISAFSKASHDNLAYYCESIERFMTKEYTTSKQDRLRSTLRVSGLTEHKIHIGQLTYNFLDFGRKSFTRKWIHALEHIPIFIFAVDIARFIEDTIYNVSGGEIISHYLQTHLDSFSSYINSRWFSRACFIVVLLKTPTLPSVLRSTSLSSYFPDYTGSNRVEDYVEYVKKRFEALNKGPEIDLEIHDVDWQYEQATLARRIIASTQDFIIQRTLRDVGISEKARE